MNTFKSASTISKSTSPRSLLLFQHPKPQQTAPDNQRDQPTMGKKKRGSNNKKKNSGGRNGGGSKPSASGGSPTPKKHYVGRREVPPPPMMKNDVEETSTGDCWIPIDKSDGATKKISEELQRDIGAGGRAGPPTDNGADDHIGDVEIITPRLTELNNGTVEKTDADAGKIIKAGVCDDVLFSDEKKLKGFATPSGVEDEVDIAMSNDVPSNATIDDPSPENSANSEAVSDKKIEVLPSSKQREDVAPPGVEEEVHTVTSSDVVLNATIDNPPSGGLNDLEAVSDKVVPSSNKIEGFATPPGVEGKINIAAESSDSNDVLLDASNNASSSHADPDSGNLSSINGTVEESATAPSIDGTDAARSSTELEIGEVGDATNSDSPSGGSPDSGSTSPINGTVEESTTSPSADGTDASGSSTEVEIAAVANATNNDSLGGSPNSQNTSPTNDIVEESAGTSSADHTDAAGQVEIVTVVNATNDDSTLGGSTDSKNVSPMNDTVQDSSGLSSADAIEEVQPSTEVEIVEVVAVTKNNDPPSSGSTDSENVSPVKKIVEESASFSCAGVADAAETSTKVETKERSAVQFDNGVSSQSRNCNQTDEAMPINETPALEASCSGDDDTSRTSESIRTYFSNLSMEVVDLDAPEREEETLPPLVRAFTGTPNGISLTSRKSLSPGFQDSTERDAFGFLTTSLRETLGDDAIGVSEETLSRYIRWKPDVKRAADRYRAYRKFRKENPYVFDGTPLLLSQDPKLAFLLQRGMAIAPEELLAKDGSAVVILRAAKCDVSTHDCGIQDASRAIFYILQKVAERNTLDPLKGISIILDLAGVANKNVPRRLVALLSKAAGCLPLRIQAIYVVAMPWWYPVGQRKLLSVKMRTRIRLLKEKTELFEFIEKDRLLEEDGGIYSFDLQSWISSTVLAEVEQLE